MKVDLFAIEEPPSFEPLQIYIKYLKHKYGGFRNNQMQCIQDFWRENDNFLYTMYTCLIWFEIELSSVFVENHIVKIFLCKIDKRLLDLDTSRIILNYNNKA